MALMLKPARELEPGDFVDILGRIRAVKRFGTTVDVLFGTGQRRTYPAGLLIEVRAPASRAG